jgi:hypothetical protein
VPRRSALGRELSCCLQGVVRAGPGAKPRQRSALDREPSCCLQDAPAGVSGHGVAVALGSVSPLQGGSDDSLASSPGAPDATCADSLNTPAGKPNRNRSSLGDNRAAVVSGRRLGCRRLAGDESEKVGRVAGNNSSGDHSSAGLRIRNASGAHSVQNRADAATIADKKVRRSEFFSGFRNYYRVFLPRPRGWGRYPPNRRNRCSFRPAPTLQETGRQSCGKYFNEAGSSEKW